MHVHVERVGSLAKVSLSVPSDEFQREFQSGLADVGRSVRMKGFRPGKVPLHVIEKRHGEAVRHEVREHFVRRAFQKAVEDEGLKPMAHPRVDLAALTGDTGADFELEFEISLRPEVKLGEYRGLAIESELEPVLAQHVESALGELRREQSTPEPAGEAGCGEEGLITAEVTFLHEGEEVFRREGLRLSGRTPPPGVDPDAFLQAFRTATSGQTLELEALLPDSLEKEEARGQTGVCRIRVGEAFRMVPPTDEDIQALLGVDSDEALRQSVKEQLEIQVRERELARQETALLQRVIAGAELELPEPLVEEQTGARLRKLHEELEARGVPHETIHQAIDEQRATAREEASNGLAARRVVEAIGEKEGLLVTREEIDEELSRIASRNRVGVEEVREYYTREGLVSQMAIEILERKVRKFLRENAEVREPS